MLLLMALPGLCLAHKVMLNAWIEDGELYAEVAFGDGSPASDAEVSVLDPDSGDVLFSAMTNDKGIVEAVLPLEVFAKGGNLLVVGNAGAGHRAERLLAAEEISAPSGVSKKVESGTDAAVARSASGSDTVEVSMLEPLVQEAVRREIKPLVREIRSLKQEGPRLQDIIGGIGYIFGLAGVGMLIKGRQDRKGQKASGRDA